MEPKRRKVEGAASRRTVSPQAEKNDTVAASVNIPTVQVVQTSGFHLRIQQAKVHAVTQAQQEGCTGNFRIFDSPFGNFLLPVIPTRAELELEKWATSDEIACGVRDLGRYLCSEYWRKILLWFP